MIGLETVSVKLQSLCSICSIAVDCESESRSLPHYLSVLALTRRSENEDHDGRTDGTLTTSFPNYWPPFAGGVQTAATARVPSQGVLYE